MQNVEFAKPFRFSPNGVEVVDYLPGKHDVSDRCAQAAKEAGVLATTKSKTPRPRAVPVQAAPETAAAPAPAPAAPETK